MSASDIFHILSFILPISLNVYIGQKLGISKMKALLVTGFSSILGCAVLILLPWLESGVIGPLNMVKIFVFSAPIYYISSLTFKVSFRKICDMHCVFPVFLFAIYHIACIFDDCCNGFDYIEGTYMCDLAIELTGTNRIPLEAFESLSAFLITAVIFGIAYKKRFALNGRLHFVMLIIYGVQRFFWEILRNNKKIVVFSEMTNAVSGDFGLSIHNFYCIAMIIIGVIFLAAFHFIDKKKAQEVSTE